MSSSSSDEVGDDLQEMKETVGEESEMQVLTRQKRMVENERSCLSSPGTSGRDISENYFSPMREALLCFIISASCMDIKMMRMISVAPENLFRT